MRIVMLGPPGSGKGTQGVRVAAALGVPHISSGAALRAHAGPELLARMATGELIDDETMTGIVRRRLEQPDARQGFVLDGFPRDRSQAARLDAELGDAGLDAVVLLDAPRDELLERMTARAQIEQRADDTPETIARRLDVYEEQTAPLTEHYRRAGLLRRVDGTGPVDDVAARVAAALDRGGD